jgi:hypothetical protein
LSDVRISNAIGFVRNKGDEEDDPFRPSSKVQRSLMSGDGLEVEIVEGSEGSTGTRDSDPGTPPTTRSMAYTKQLARRVAEKNARVRQKNLSRPVEADDSARKEIMASDAEDGDVVLARAEFGGFVRTLEGVVELLMEIAKKLGVEKNKDDVVMRVHQTVDGLTRSLEICGKRKEKRTKRRVGPVDGLGSRMMPASEMGQPKRKETSPAELSIMEGRKRPRKGEVSYAEACGSVAGRRGVEEDYSDDSEGWRRIERRKRERRTPRTGDAPKVRPMDSRGWPGRIEVPTGRGEEGKCSL